VLNNFVPILRTFVDKWNSKAQKSKASVPPLSSSFVAAGSRSSKSKSSPSGRVSSRVSLLQAAHDWQMLADFGHSRMVFPPEIVPTTQRPDVVLWSTSTRRVFLIELTCPAEENIEIASVFKASKYKELADAIEQAGWTVGVKPIEVGARGCVARSVPRLLREFGFSSREATTAVRTLATVVARCSFTIYLAASRPEWQKPALL
jgi:hypothetical protein